MSTHMKRRDLPFTRGNSEQGPSFFLGIYRLPGVII